MFYPNNAFQESPSVGTSILIANSIYESQIISNEHIYIKRKSVMLFCRRFYILFDYCRQLFVIMWLD